MIYLKPYKIFETIDMDQLKFDVNNIFLSEVSNEDKFDIDVIQSDNKIWISIELSNYLDYNGFKLIEVRDVLLRIKDFLEDSCGKMYILVAGETERFGVEITKSNIIEINRYYNMIDTNGISNIAISVI